MAGHGRAGQCADGRGKAWQGLARPGAALYGMAWQSKAKQSKDFN